MQLNASLLQINDPPSILWQMKYVYFILLNPIITARIYEHVTQWATAGHWLDMSGLALWIEVVGGVTEWGQGPIDYVRWNLAHKSQFKVNTGWLECGRSLGSSLLGYKSFSFLKKSNSYKTEMEWLLNCILKAIIFESVWNWIIRRLRLGRAGFTF